MNTGKAVTKKKKKLRDDCCCKYYKVDRGLAVLTLGEPDLGYMFSS